MSFKTPVHTTFPRHHVLDLKTRFVYDDGVDDVCVSHTKSFQKLLRESTDFSNHSFPVGLHVWSPFDAEDNDALICLPKRIDFDGSFHNGSRFKSLRMKKVDFRNSDVCYSRFLYCKMRKATFNDATLTGVNFYRTDLKRADFSGAELDTVTFSDCNLWAADFTDVDLSRVTFHHCAMVGMIISRDLYLVGERPFLKVSDVGSEQEPVMLFVTDKGPMVQRGCFFDTLDAFGAAVRNNSSHFDLHENKYTATGAQYLKIIELFHQHVTSFPARQGDLKKPE